MKNEKTRPIGLRILNSLCATALLVSVLYIIFTGIQAAAIGVALLALAGVAAPVAMNGEGLLEILSGIFEALIEGIVGIFEAIADLISGMFG